MRSLIWKKPMKSSGRHPIPMRERSTLATVNLPPRPTNPPIMEKPIVVPTNHHRRSRNNALLDTFGMSEGLHSRRKMIVHLNRSGIKVNPGTVHEIVGDRGLFGAVSGKKLQNIIPAKDVVQAGSLVNRNFTAPAPNRVWVADLTYCRI